MTNKTQQSPNNLDKVETLVTDLDDTLVPFRRAFTAYGATLVRELAKESGLKEDKIIKGFNEHYNKSGVFTFVDVINQHKPLKEKFPGEDLSKKFANPIEKAKKAHNDALVPDKGTVEMLKGLKDKGMNLVLYTAGPASFTVDKMKEAGLDGLFDAVYAVEDKRPEGANDPKADHPGKAWDNMTTLPRYPKVTTDALKDIVHRFHPDMKKDGIDGSKIAMMGDNGMLDIAMGHKLGVRTIHVTGYRDEPVNRINSNIMKKMLHKTLQSTQEARAKAAQQPSSRWLKKTVTPSLSVKSPVEISKHLGQKRNNMLDKALANAKQGR